MESNNNDNHVLVLEDRTEVKNEKEVGKLSVVSGIDDKGKLQTTEATAANQAAFLTFNGRDELLKNFMTNFLKQFNEPSRFGLYKVLASNVEQGVEGLRGMLLNKDSAENKQKLVVTHLTYCISTRYLIRDNVTTNSMFSLVEKRSNSRALCVIVFVLPRLQCDASCIGVLSVHFPAGSPSPSLEHHPRLSIVRLRRRRE